MSARILFVFMSLLLVTPGHGQGFGGLGSTAEGFAVPQRGVSLTFPRDHGPHTDFRIEWWYLTANLTGADGQSYGVQWTLFRSALRPEDRENQAVGWSSPQLWMGHAAVTSRDHHFVSEVRARGGIGQAGVTMEPFSARINDWAMTSTAQANADALSSLALNASGSQFSYQLDLTADGPLVLHGDEGYSIKSSGGQASHYYSQPSYSVKGTLMLPSGTIEVTGSAWLDREWSSQPLADNQNGWDWVSLSFDDGAKLMGFRLRQTDGAHFTSATWIAANGQPDAISNGELSLTPLTTVSVADREIPIRWRVQLPSRSVDVEIDALNPQAWMATSIPYWEGPVEISGSRSGKGYLEMTGY